ncbi:MAG: AgmX/PglI C-terminal domain-containing protein [Myxococcota bacterium]
MKRIVALSVLLAAPAVAQNPENVGVMQRLATDPLPVVVVLDGVPTGLDEADTSARLRELQEDARRCVGESDEQWRFEVVVRRSGRVRRVATPTPRTRPVNCLRRLLRTLRLPSRTEGGDLTLQVRVERSLRNRGTTLVPENVGFGGLGLRGTGRGGGGSGSGTIGLGTLNRAAPAVRLGEGRVRGPRSAQSVGAVVGAHVSGIRHCYATALSQTPSLEGTATEEHTAVPEETAEGTVVVDFVIDPDGSVATASIGTGSTLQDAGLHACIINEISGWRFATSSATATARYPFVLSPPSLRRGLTRDAVQRVIRRHHRVVRACYEEALQRTPTLEGRVNLSFTISPTGQVRAAEIREDTLRDPAVARCLADAALTWRFPAPMGGGSVVVNYPFLFQTSE